MTNLHRVHAGSATQQKLWSYRALTLAGHELRIETRVFDPRQRRFVPGDTQEVTLPAAGRAREAQPA